MSVIIKFILAVLLIGCLFDVPYGYFQFIRVAGCIGFAWLAYKEFEENNSILGILCIGVAILLNPVFKIHFVRKTWNNIDLVIAIGLIIWIIFDVFISKAKKSSEGIIKDK